ncbi:aminotransferase V [Paraliobacillus quinghaiensis]|uniref:Aminotransferase V n=1 Tax=Paraliobacillus quinghaiensis TaxID=470815 RepID=A0A917TKH2_9BACI|nr:cysteine desulfurase family protein [Paraliobacillus quinghaiensis]GGM26495.1 aminotransferase V [Paraliobacillus quinghaiensis]
MIYFDNSATTKPFPEVLESFLKVSQQFYGNPSSIHRFGIDAENLLRKAQNQASELFGVEQEEIVFTSGGTEGNNMAIKGIALAHQNKGRHIITTEIEHPSVIEACKSLETLGFTVTYLPVDSNGIVKFADVKQAITKETILVSIMHVNNELGTIQPVEAIGKMLKEMPRIYFHVDHVQGYGKIPLDMNGTGIDLCTVSGHKIHGLKGTGLLYVKKGTKLFPLLHGGNQQSNLRSGTENLAGIVSLVKAMRLITEKSKTHSEYLKELNQQLRAELLAISFIKINTIEDQAPHILNISIPGYKPEVIIHALGERDIFISTKSACSSKKTDESAVLKAVGFSHDRTISALRISLSYYNTKEEIELFSRSLQRVVQQLSKVMG